MKDYTTGTSVCAYLSIAHIFFDKYAISLPAGKKVFLLAPQDAQWAKNGKNSAVNNVCTSGCMITSRARSFKSE